MQTFLQTPFLQSLAYALLSSFWQMGLLWICTICLFKIFKFSSTQKFNIAFAAQLFGFVLFMYTLFDAYKNHISVIGYAGGFADSVNAYVNLLMPYFAVVYLAMLVYRLGALFFMYRFTQNLRKQDLRKISPDNRMFVEDVSALFSLRKKVRIYLSGKIKCPLTIGFFKPVILIPIAAVNYLSAEQMEAVILHELAHIKRADYLLFLLQEIIGRIFFFNVFSRMLGDILEHERENACDDCVLQFKYNSMHYAEALLKLARMQANSSFAMAASGKKKSVLLVRIKRLMRPQSTKMEYSFNSMLFSLFTLIIAFGAMASFTLKKSVALPADSTQRQTVSVNKQINAEVTVSGLMPVAKKSIEDSKQKNIEPVKPLIAENVVEKKFQTRNQPQPVIAAVEPMKIDPAFLISVNHQIDSFTRVLPQINSAINKQLVVTPEVYKQALSYQNFKELENMLVTTGDSVRVTESDVTKDSYQKLITIETTDKNGDKHVYNVIVELYQ